MDLLTVSRLYHAGGTVLPWWTAELFLIVLVLCAAQWRARGRWRRLAGLLRGGAAAGGLLLAGWLVAVELAVFHARCPLCLAAAVALAVAFALAGFGEPRGKPAAAALALAALATGYLLPFGTIPRLAVLAERAPDPDRDSLRRSRGTGPLRIQSFEDFQCPACAQMDRTLDRFLDQHEAQVQRVYRHFPLTSIHPWAQRAAIVSECAARQGRFETAKRSLFARQARLGAALAQRPEASWNLPDPAAFRDCVEGWQSAGAVQRDVAEARRLGLRSTPSLMIGRMLVAGSVPLSRLSTILDFARRHAAAAATGSAPAWPSGCTEASSAGGCTAP